MGRTTCVHPLSYLPIDKLEPLPPFGFLCEIGSLSPIGFLPLPGSLWHSGFLGGIGSLFRSGFLCNFGSLASHGFLEAGGYFFSSLSTISHGVINPS